MSQLTDVKDIGPHAAGLLAAAGLDTPKALAEADLARIATVRGFGPKRAETVRDAARALLAETLAPAPEKKAKKKKKKGEDKTSKGKNGKKGKKVKKGKKGKKGKKKNKDSVKKGKEKSDKKKKSKKKK